jgi:hypothetical protein
MPWHEVVGVDQNVREKGVNQTSPAIVYWPSMIENLYGPGPLDARRTAYFALLSSRAGTQTFINEMQHAGWSAAYRRLSPISPVLQFSFFAIAICPHCV